MTHAEVVVIRQHGVWLLPGKIHLIPLAMVTYPLLEVIVNTALIWEYPETFKPPEPFELAFHLSFQHMCTCGTCQINGGA